MIVVDLSKQQALDADPKAIKQINFIANLDRPGNTRSISFFFSFILRLFTRNCRNLVNVLYNTISSNNLIFINF